MIFLYQEIMDYGYTENECPSINAGSHFSKWRGLKIPTALV